MNNCLFFACNKANINVVIKDIQQKEMDLNVISDVASFLGVLIKQLNNDQVKLLQIGLIDRIIQALKLKNANPAVTPTNKEPLVCDAERDTCSKTFNYASVVGMLSYLTSNTWPGISFAVNQCVHFVKNPRASHKHASKQIDSYLLGM